MAVSGDGAAELKMELTPDQSRGLLCCGLLESVETCLMRLTLLGSSHRLVSEAAVPLATLAQGKGSPVSPTALGKLTEALEAC